MYSNEWDDTIEYRGVATRLCYINPYLLIKVNYTNSDQYMTSDS